MKEVVWGFGPQIMENKSRYSASYEKGNESRVELQNKCDVTIQCKFVKFSSGCGQLIHFYVIWMFHKGSS